MLPLAAPRPADSGPSAAHHHDVLVLVQDRMVISTYAGGQTDAALDLARVLCRALGQAVELYRLPQAAAGEVRAGMAIAATGAPWSRFAEVHPTRRGDIAIELSDSPAPAQRLEA